MTSILKKFRIRYLPQDFIIMYCELSDGRFSKTYKLEDKVISEFIDKQEYLSGLASLLLRFPT